MAAVVTVLPSVPRCSKMFQDVLTYSNHEDQLWISYEQLVSTKSTFIKDLLGFSSVPDGRHGRLAAYSLTSSRTGHSPAVQRQGATGVGGGRIILLRLWQQQQGLAKHGDVSKHLMARKWGCRMDSNGFFSGECGEKFQAPTKTLELAMLPAPAP